MRILHVGWGFWPFRKGGLINYAQDLMAGQAERGHDVAYFFTGRHYRGRSGPRIERWRVGEVEMHEVIDGPIVSGLELGTQFPELELNEPWLESAFDELVRTFRPDVVHFQELLCVPSSLIDVAAEAGAGTVMTLQDYFPLCSTLRLFDADGAFCTRLEVGEDCVARNAQAPANRRSFVEETLWYATWNWHRRLHDRIGPRLDWLYYPMARRARDLALRRFDREEPAPARRPGSELAPAFQRRRDVNVERLGRVGRLVAQSPRLKEIYEARGVSTERMTTLRFTLAHIEDLRPRELSSPPAPVVFATLGGCASATKGSRVLVGALRALREAGLGGDFRLRIFGGVDPAVRAELETYPEVQLHGEYGREQLDTLLEDVDVGIMPSIWEEAYGYSGVELLAKGIPLIANPVGGIVEYAREGETAWLNSARSGSGLADLMAKLIGDPGQVVEMNARVREARDRLVRPYAEHVEAIEEIYREASVS